MDSGIYTKQAACADITSPYYNICIGCGVCAFICPKNNISIVLNKRGFYQIEKQQDDYCKNCNLCFKVCPFGNINENETDIGKRLFRNDENINYLPETGYYKKSYSGYVNQVKERLESASGGMATWFLKQILRKNIVDKIVCVTSDYSPNPLFKYVVCKTEEELDNCRRSAYYPLHMCNLLEFIMETDGRYAVTCLPCQAKALRLASKINKKLNKRIKFIIGLVCGHGVNSFFSEYVLAKAGGDYSSKHSVIFRTKSSDKPASDLGIDCLWNENGSSFKTKRIFWSQGIGKAWSNYWFCPEPCLFCDDIFAETADIVFMDAWLPEYIKDYRGTSLILSRSKIATELIEKSCINKSAIIEECDIKKIIKSQSSVIKDKREGLAYRLWSLKSKGFNIPDKRVKPKKAANMLERIHWKNQIKAVEIGPNLWNTTKSTKKFELLMNRISLWERIFKKIKFITVFPLRGCRKIFRLCRAFVGNNNE